MDKLIIAFAPAFAAAFALQQFLEILSPVIEKITATNKKILLGLTSLIIGLVLSFSTGLHVLEPLGTQNVQIWDGIVTGLIISGGTEGFNSIMKFLGYSKQKRKEEAEEASSNGNK